MPNLLAMSFEGELAPSFDLRCLHAGRKLPDGWGIGYYPGGEPSASVLKEPAPPQGSIRSELVKAWEHLESSVFLLHIRIATWGQLSDANTQPFSRSHGGRDWLFVHAGSLAQRFPRAEDAAFTPVGSTDTEAIFCDLLGRFAKKGWRSLGDADPHELRDWFEELNRLGTITAVLTDGRDLCVYADAGDRVSIETNDRAERGIYVWKLVPPYGELSFGDDDLEVDLARRGVKSRKGVLVSSAPLELTGESDVKPAWEKVPPGHLIVVRQGAVRAHVGPKTEKRSGSILPTGPRLPVRAPVRRFSVLHRTTYRYDKPVERSTHVLRLIPAHDRLQTVLDSAVTVSVPGASREYDDVFGNRARRILIDTPYTEMTIEGRSRVELLDVEPFPGGLRHPRTTIPLVWMPWQRHMLQPFLLPPELPESELRELTEYANSFVERNDYDVVDTLLDLNNSIFREYAYRQGTTNLQTTPFDVYVNRRGVCQDFANLFICLARLLGVPARYACGYVYTGPKGENHVQSEASHAWVQVYLPEVGWRGFDPTNGILTQTDHIRVAVGRNYVDATPTSGTIYVGGGREVLEVELRVEPCD
ncbi:MAG: class II glutamine amidotransferase [Myxococcales bacterium]|nr:class II glutamine amidotransferase [Myxococcales bacterium]